MLMVLSCMVVVVMFFYFRIFAGWCAWYYHCCQYVLFTETGYFPQSIWYCTKSFPWSFLFHLSCLVWYCALIVILFLILMNNRMQLLGLWFGCRYHHHIHRLKLFFVIVVPFCCFLSSLVRFRTLIRNVCCCCKVCI